MRIASHPLRLMVMLVVGAASSSGLAQDYPNRPLRIVVPVQPGGANDTLTRFMAPKLAAALHQPVLVDNRPGASTTIGTALVAKSAPDGYMLLMAPSAHTVNASLYGSLPYDPIRDFTPVSAVASAPLLLIVHPSLPARSLKELIALAKARSGEMIYASSGNGTSSHLAAELFQSLIGARMIHIPYKGGAPATIDLVGGHVLLMFATVQSSMPHVAARKLRALAVTSSHRSSLANDVPTMAEAGLPGVEVGSWFGVVGPAGLGREVVTRLDGAIKRISQSAEMRERLTVMGYESIYMPPEEFAAFLKADLEKWSKVIRQAGIRIES